jgi:release factor glutamine methyltransferase
VTTTEALRAITLRLQAVGIENARREARLILAAAMHLDAAGLLLLEEVPEAVFEPYVARREKREPLAFILGRREFWGLSFQVSPTTLIPRPESETLIEVALQDFAARSEVRTILDLGTGTGCLLLAALHEFPRAFGVGVDRVAEAAALAARNAKALGLQERSAFFAGDWADAICGQFDLVLSNPPYIPEQDISELMPEVARFEPRSALAGGADGLAAYRSIFGALRALLSPSGLAILEIGIGQAPALTALAAQAGFEAALRHDLANIPRALLVRA